MKQITIIFASLFMFALNASAHNFKKVNGIGIVVEKNERHGIFVKDIVPNSPAAIDGTIEKGDFVLSVKTSNKSDWKATNGLAVEEVIGLIRGNIDTQVGIKLYKPTDHSQPEVFLNRVFSLVTPSIIFLLVSE